MQNPFRKKSIEYREECQILMDFEMTEKKMSSWSLCMIVKNEEDVLERCLNSVRELVDEIIIVDTGSEDGTKQTAERFTDQIYDFQWGDDFAAARNFSFARASGDYLMWMDADDVLPESSLHLLAEKKERMDPKTDVIMLPYQTAFDEAGNPVFIYERERIVRNCPRSVWIGPVHEVIVPFGNILHLEAPIRHEKNGPGESGRNLRIYEGQLAKGWKLDARQQYYYGRELYFHERYEEAEKVFQRFLKNPDAWIVNRVDALRLLAGCRYRQGREEEALEALLHALTLDRPRAEICCDLGKHFLDRGRYEAAVFWYQAALSLPERTDEGGFVERDCCGFLPCIQLCICFDRLGDRRQAEEYNERAGRYRPQSPYYLQNRRYFGHEE